ncbi:hypothetical protein Nwi_1711 [Nitrobacter winogradskyi Nb-255]|uniref:Uncharacterized protein n=1 Tax=Nitrobacter winogradskyi (strain ATCC 25391 / DSM 10237 / CIP 104748 / NCIMB 11846 / Nb-255) TaxID=323098 RepID=Q3SRW9_NITWN|nr:hypothetical protein [Nitrobacter winogradskyi]ABA04972.1 hypothetical protein Nwi_1711 [Nitrobacter winogradskyi Nb-255]
MRERPNRNEELRDDESCLGDPPGDGGPDEAAHYLAGAVADLALIARRHGLDTLGYLLDMAQLEAEEIVRLRTARKGS